MSSPHPRLKAALPQADHLSGHKRREVVFHQGIRIQEEGFTLRALASGCPDIRLSCIVGRQQFPQATKRNRLKRWLREAFRKVEATVPSGMEIQIVVSRAAEEMDFTDVERIVIKLCKRLISEREVSL